MRVVRICVHLYACIYNITIENPCGVWKIVIPPKRSKSNMFQGKKRGLKTLSFWQWLPKIRGHVFFWRCTLNLETSFGDPCAIVTTWMFHLSRGGLKVRYHGANNSLGNLALKAYLDVPGTSRYHLQSFACGICWILGWYCSCIYQAVYSCFYLFIVFNLWTNRQQVSAIYCNQVMYQNRKKLITGWLIRQSTTSTFDGIFFLVSAKLPCHETRLSLAITLRVLRFAKWFGTMTHIFGPVYKCKYMRYMIYVHVFAIWVKYVGFKFHLATLSTLLTSGFIEVACNSYKTSS